MAPDNTRNTLRARLTFSFRGEDNALETVIDLDQCEGDADVAPDFHQWLARAGNIDPYSYQYEVLESEEISFDQPTGLAAHCCSNGDFDWLAFVSLRREARDLDVVRTIARQTLGVADLDTDARLKAALLAVYRAGLAQRK
jgi:hypothetical protein